MQLEEKTLSNLKHFLVYNTINSINNPPFYNKLDELLVKKRFSNAYELSLNENIFKIDMSLISDKDITKMVSEFNKIAKTKSVFIKRNIYEILKISNLPTQKLHKLFEKENFKTLIKSLNIVSCETKLLSFNFIVLRIADNFIIRLKNSNNRLANEFEKIREFTLNKIINFEYNFDPKEKENTYLCWVDRILSATINKEISPKDFQKICEKILNTTNHTVYTYWKILNSLNFLLLQSDFSALTYLRAFRSKINKTIEEKYTLINVSKENVKDLAISTLARDFPVKEDFYYLFDCIKILSTNSNEDKDFSLDLCFYIIYHDTKYNIFSYRFIRKYFIEMILSILKTHDNIKLKDKEILLLLKLFHVDHFYSFYRKDIFNSIVNILKNINVFEEKVTNGNFYKYLDMLDYIMYANNDISKDDIVDFLACGKDNRNKIIKRFKLQSFVN